MEEIYRGITITLREETNDWVCQIDAKNNIKSTLPEARKRIDAFLNKEEKYKPIELFVIIDIFYNKLKLGDKIIVTSECFENNYKYFWINNNGKRSKELSSKFCLDTPENLREIENIKDKKRNITLLEKEILEIINKLQIK